MTLFIFFLDLFAAFTQNHTAMQQHYNIHIQSVPLLQDMEGEETPERLLKSSPVPPHYPSVNQDC